MREAKSVHVIDCFAEIVDPRVDGCRRGWCDRLVILLSRELGSQKLRIALGTQTSNETIPNDATLELDDVRVWVVLDLLQRLRLQQKVFCDSICSL